ncbi:MULTISPECIES: TIGR02450 family Trp-rich protein [Deefgea]|uniref:TIGR02450 family Trp-rich protein n=1 Tax=Deefgea chitinilytica TaxID=570276 RepID=A0ABS2CFU7_9NEIS|nr:MULTISPECIES: TIGR02450 family Trp-rich protein [Deefgea]MBM5573020.1 TIGR02450 family Trp-rich protein [Deefgea chitinilytica]MBM9890256.1 TIGR02450 family Trp-rich protein [Deefgea sp. CFH1-16]
MTQPTRTWHPKKLLKSKWTAAVSQQREKHFIVVKVETDPDDAQKVEHVTLEAVLSKRHFTLHWSALTDETQWRVGWL